MADYTPNSRTIKLEGFAEFEQQLREMAAQCIHAQMEEYPPSCMAWCLV